MESPTRRSLWMFLGFGLMGFACGFAIVSLGEGTGLAETLQWVFLMGGIASLAEGLAYVVGRRSGADIGLSLGLGVYLLVVGVRWAAGDVLWYWLAAGGIGLMFVAAAARQARVPA